MDWHLETQSINAMLQKIRKPVQERLVHCSPAWSLSHIMRVGMSDWLEGIDLRFKASVVNNPIQEDVLVPIRVTLRM